MPSMMRKVYYREPEIFVRGRYGHNIPVEEVLSYKKTLTEKYGARLCKIVIEYSKKKDGIKITPITFETINDVTVYLFYRDSLDNTMIFYERTNKEDPKTVIVDKDGQITTR